MRAPFRNDPMNPWDEDEIGDYYRNGYALPASPEVHVDLDRPPAIPFGFQLPTRPRKPTSRQARAAQRRASR